MWSPAISKVLHAFKTHRYLFAVVGVWLGILWLGFWQVHAYSSRAGASGAAPPQIASGTLAPLAHAGPRLVVFAHPHCPCTRASLTELATILELSQQAVAAEVHFVRPPGVPAGWERTATWKAAAKLPGVRVFGDEAGVLAERLGAATSGHAVLYDAAGKLLFQGGLTRARGQTGDSPARRTILRLLAGEAAPAQAQVYGCPLLNSSNFGPSNCCALEGGSCQSCQ